MRSCAATPSSRHHHRSCGSLALISLLITLTSAYTHATKVSVSVSRNKPARPHDLHLVRDVQDVYPPPARGAYLYTLKLMHDQQQQAVFLDWVFSSVLSLNDTAPVYDIVVLIDGEQRNTTLAAQLHAVGATRVVWVNELLDTLPANAAQSYKQLLQRRNSHAQYPGMCGRAYCSTGMLVHTMQPHHLGTWTKLLAWSMSGAYDKVVAMDADIMAYANADDLLSYPELAAVPELLYPIISKEYLILFNAGLLVLQPNMVWSGVLCAIIQQAHDMVVVAHHRTCLSSWCVQLKRCACCY